MKDDFCSPEEARRLVRIVGLQPCGGGDPDYKCGHKSCQDIREACRQLVLLANYRAGIKAALDLGEAIQAVKEMWNRSRLVPNKLKEDE